MAGGDNDTAVVHTDEAENLATRCAACDACEALRDEVGAGVPSWEHIPLLDTAAEVTAFRGLTQTSELHSADADGILAHYALSEEVRCSLKGRHLHRKGLMVQALCGLTLCMGFDCGKKSIIGFDQLEAEYKRRTTFQQDVYYVGKWAGEFEQRLAVLRPRIKVVREIASVLRSRLPDLHSILDKRRKEKKLKVKLPDHAGSKALVGMAILDADARDLAKLERILREFQRAYAQDPPITGSACAALMRRAKEGNRAADNMDAWLRDAGEFVSEENLSLALVALGQNGEVSASSEGVKVRYLGSLEALLPYARWLTGSPAV
jgi:hypothetical protein